ncbi:hypothetical protein [Sabulibacter ruber]|uniref:hypothetical protein n=1 Tax=Sabulibacter ruber TaxID=2811901 RepID=UPI001A97B4A6|nr:hypothetical protein [Sabulibacter ruber]
MKRKIKYQGGITKLLCQTKASWNKRKFIKGVLHKQKVSLHNRKHVPFEIISFSGSHGFEDQILSIMSMVHYAGTPPKWTIYSDGTYTNEQKSVFKTLFSFVEVKNWNALHQLDNIKVYQELLRVNVLAKKLNVILCHPHQNQTLFIDSDIIFYKNIPYYLNSHLLQQGLWYVPDTIAEIGNHFNQARESFYPLNSGLLVINNTFDSRDIFLYLERLNNNFCYFSEQLAFEYAFTKQGANILDPRQFIIDSSDQFDFAMGYHPGKIAMRHYTGPVRHKIWQMGWKWHFNSDN